jgi:tetratricopeptide (TPR) repeat protein
MSVLSGLADLDRLAGKYERAERAYLKLYKYAERRRDRLSIISVNFTTLSLASGDHDAASEWIQRAEMQASEMDRAWPAIHVCRLALAAIDQQAWEWDEQIVRLEACLDDTGFVDIDLAVTLELAADHALDWGEPSRARQALEIARELWTRMGVAHRAERVGRLISDRS